MCANWGFNKLAKKHMEESIGEMKHAELLIDRILFLEGTPDIASYDVIRVGDNVKAQLENDLALDGLYAGGPGSPAPLPGSARLWASAGLSALLLALIAGSLPHEELSALSIGGSIGGSIDLIAAEAAGPAIRLIALVVGMGAWLFPAAGIPRWFAWILIGGAGIDPDFLSGSLIFADAFVIPTLYHLVSWLILSIEKNSLPRTPKAFAWELAGIHSLPLAVLGLAFCLGPESGKVLEAALFSPASYLFWSVAHVVQTWIIRRGCTALPDPRPRAGSTSKPAENPGGEQELKG